jgi:hypothetical protein
MHRSEPPAGRVPLQVSQPDGAGLFVKRRTCPLIRRVSKSRGRTDPGGVHYTESCWPHGTLGVLPDECVVQVLVWVARPRDVLAVAQTCRRLYALARDDHLWHLLFALHVPSDNGTYALPAPALALRWARCGSPSKSHSGISVEASAQGRGMARQVHLCRCNRPAAHTTQRTYRIAIL